MQRSETECSRRFAVAATWLCVLPCFCATAWGAVPPPSETPAKVIVNGRTSTAIDVKIVKVGQELPDTFSAPKCHSIPGYDWYVSEHFALRSQIDEAQSRQYLLYAELAYPHYVWIFGRQPEGTGRKRIALTFSRNLQELKKATDVDHQYWRGGGGGVTMWGNGMSYNYPGGGLQAHKRGLVLHENLHAFHMALNGFGKGLQGWPGWFYEGIAYSLEQHVYNSAKKQLTVMVFDRAVGNNYTDAALATLRKEPLTISDVWFGKERLGYRPDVYQLVIQFLWSDPDRQMRLRVWQDARFRGCVNDRALLESLFDLDVLDKQWLAWLKDRQNTFHWVDWGMEQEGDTFWTYGYPNWARYVQLNVNLLLKEKAETDDPYVMDWPVYSPQPHHLIGDVSRGGEEPSIGCLVDFSRAIRECAGWGFGGLGFGVGGTGKRADGKSNVDQEYLAVFVANIGRTPGGTLRFDGDTVGIAKEPEQFSPDFLTAARAGQVVGMTATLRKDALRIVLRAGPAEALKTHGTEIPLTAEQRERLLSKPWCLLSHAAYMGLTPYPGVHRTETRDLSKPEPAGRTRFLATSELAELYALSHHLGKDTPNALLRLRDRLLASAAQPLAAQQALRDEYLALRPALLAEVTALEDKAAALRAAEVLTGFRWDASVTSGSKPGDIALELRASIGSSDSIRGRISFASGDDDVVLPEPVAFTVAPGKPFSGRAVVSFQPQAQMPTKIKVTVEPVIAGHTLSRTKQVVAFTSVARWLVLGPFDNKGDGTVDTVQEPETEPFLAEKEYAGHGGRKICWELRDRHPDKAPMTPAVVPLSGNNNAAYYALTWIESPEERDVVLAIGSDDGVVVWFNNERVHAKLVHRGHVPKQDRVPVRLQKGMNKLMLKVTQAWGPWQFSVYVLDEHGNEVTGLRNWLSPDKHAVAVKP